jgi:phosphoglycerate transporter family protein
MDPVINPNPMAVAGAQPAARGWLRHFLPRPAGAIVSDDPEILARSYRSWRTRVLVSSIIGYATYYFVRKNLSTAMPMMEQNLGIHKTDLGLFLSLHGVIYGISKFANGFLGDRADARLFMVVGLVGSAIVNVLFGFSSTVAVLGSLWMLNGWFQGMGFPPCARLLTHWFPPRELATKMSIWNTSHSIGAGIIVVLCGYLVLGSWRLCFIVPAALAFLCAIYLWRTLPDTPRSVGLPELDSTQKTLPAAGTRADFWPILKRYVFSNPYIWIVSLANFFVYTMRYTILDWGPTLLTQSKHIQITHAAWMVAGFEGSGLTGALLAGWVTDRFFGGRGARASVFFMICAGISIFLFWKNPYPSELLNTALLCMSGFFIYGPQCLVGIIAANLGTNRAAASAVGLTGLFGYASTVLSGVGLGALVQHRGWDMGFAGLLGVAAIGTVLFIAAWPARAHGYDTAD